MLPVVAAGGAAAMNVAARTAPAIMAAARQSASRLFAASPQVVDVVAKRTGVAGGVKKILEVMSSNKMVAALVLMDMGVEGAALLTELASADPAIAEMVQRYGWTPDPVKAETKGDIALQAEELNAISEAADVLGGVSNLHKLRRALALTESHYQLYDTVRLLGRGLSR